MGYLVLGLFAVCVALACVGSVLAHLLYARTDRLLGRLESIERRARQRALAAPVTPGERPTPTGLPVGSVLNDFELPDLAGRLVTLSRWRGRRLLLIFFDSACGFCRRMLPELAELPADPLDGGPVPLVIARGSPDEIRPLIEAHGVRCTCLVQESREVFALYRVSGTPSGYLVDEHGATASRLAIGARAVLALADAEPTAITPAPERLTGPLPPIRLDIPDRARGPAVGSPAPAFELPSQDGDVLSLEVYRGRPVLLVFSDPECAACDRLMPDLERLHRDADDLAVLAISRGDPSANRALVDAHGLTFPIVLQTGWELSRRYGPAAAPVGYLVDPDGLVAADAALGTEAILALADRELSRQPVGAAG